MKTAIKTALTALLALALVMNSALAQYFPPVPPAPVIIRETPITVSYTEPQRVIVVNVTQFDPKQVAKKIALTLKEPVLTASFTIYLLVERPPGVPEPRETALLYFTIRAHVALLENVERAVMTFAVEKALVKEKGVDVETITLNRFFEGEWEKLPTKRVGEDEKHFYFEAESPGLSHFAVTGIAPPPFPWWIVAIIVVVAVVAVVAGIHLYRRRRPKTQ